MATYKAKQLCQKHYFRQWRYGTLELTKIGHAKERYSHSEGYLQLRRPDHPIAGKSGWIFEHRLVAYDARDGVIDWCERCHIIRISWATCHIDHIDEVRTNNAPDNLRVTCVGCNTQRRGVARGMRLTALGETKKCRAWAADPRVIVAETTIRNRKRRGSSDHDALFAPRKTHNSMPPAQVETNKFKNGRRLRT